MDGCGLLASVSCGSTRRPTFTAPPPPALLPRGSWGCAVTGVDPSVRDGLNATSVVVLCDWPLVRLLLGLAKQLFLLEQVAHERRGAGS